MLLLLQCTVSAFFRPANDGGTAASRNDLAVVLQPVLEQLTQLDAKVEKLDVKVDNLSADVQQLKLDVEVLRAATNNNAQLLEKDLELLKKDMQFYVLVCLVAIPILSTGLPAVLPSLVKTMP